jgi:hypothetical protein
MTVTTETSSDQGGSVLRTADPLEVLAISPTVWRVMDPAAGDRTTVLGVVQLIGETYEVMQEGSPLARYYFASLEDAVGYLTGRG